MAERGGIAKYLPQVDLGSKIALGSLSAYAIYKFIVCKIMLTFKSSNRKHLRYAAKKMEKAHMHVLGSVAIFGISAVSAKALRVDISPKWFIPLAAVGVIAKSVSYPARKTKYALWVTFNAGAGVLTGALMVQRPQSHALVDHCVLFSSMLAASALFASFVRAVSPRHHTANATMVTTSLVGPLFLLVPTQMLTVHYAPSFLPSSSYPVVLAERMSPWRMAASLCVASLSFGVHSFFIVTFRLQHARHFLQTPSPTEQARARFAKMRTEQRHAEAESDREAHRDSARTDARSPASEQTERRERRDSDRASERDRDRPPTPEEQEAEEDREFAELSESDEEDNEREGSAEGQNVQSQARAQSKGQKRAAREKSLAREYHPRKFGDLTREMKAVLELMVCPAHEARIDTILARLQAKHNAGHVQQSTRFASPSKRLSFGATLSMSDREHIVTLVRNENLRYLREAEERIPDLEGTLSGDPIDQSLLMVGDGPFLFLPSIIAGALFSYHDRLRRRYEQQRQAGLVRRRHAEQNRRLAALYALPFTAVGAAVGVSAGPGAGVADRPREAKRDPLTRAGQHRPSQTQTHGQGQGRDSPRTPPPSMQLLFEYDLDDVFQMRQSMRA